ncbi:MAG: CocE/NonD family hydrolase, partial [Phycisphaerales bacterium]|nr:CocE/NonD family hydrolase [Phycisphaerales bacterium]
MFQGLNASVLALGTVAVLPVGTHAAETAAGEAKPGMGPHKVREIENVWIPMSDGTQLAARIWLPEDAERDPVPGLLEYTPYRKRERPHGGPFAFYASHGYAAVCADIRGTGDSEGLPQDEYVQQEQDDGLEIIAWIAKQPWCTGKVGMFGTSWGGFNSLQVAARRPPALKAIVTFYSTDDRYTDDAHYTGGTINECMFLWGGLWQKRVIRPPDPEIVGARWREMWRARLEAIDLYVGSWLTHQHRDAFWKHGSINEDYGAI